MYKKLALAVVLGAAAIVLCFEVNQWITVDQVTAQGLYTVKSIDKNPEGTVLRAILIDRETPHINDIAWYAGDLMSRFSLRGDPRDVRIGSRLVCSKEMKVRLLSHQPVPGTAHYRCSTDIEGPGNRRVLAFLWRARAAVLG